MKWRPYFRLKLAKTAGDRHWWITSVSGNRVHQYVSVQCIEETPGGVCLFQIILGPLMLTLAGKK